MRKRLFASLTLLTTSAGASLPPATAAAPAGATTTTLQEKLLDVRTRMMSLENDLLDSVHSQRRAKDATAKIEALLGLQKRERALAKNRVAQLETTIADLERKRVEMEARVEQEKHALRRSLIELHRGKDLEPDSPEAVEALERAQPIVRLMHNLASIEIREIATVRADMLDAETLEARIAEERSQVDALLHELAESESLLEMNRQLQIDLLRQTHEVRLAQLDKYRAMKSAEFQVAGMIKDFNARMEITEAARKERSLASLLLTPFGKLKGHLVLPLTGKVVGHFGKSFDTASGLSLFRKGIDLESTGHESVGAVFEGKIAYAGELPNYGKMVIVDHGGHFYSLCGNLGEISTKVGDHVAAGSPIGVTDSTGKPLYFEIRARNIPVDPLQWVSRTLSMKE